MKWLLSRGWLACSRGKQQRRLRQRRPRARRVGEKRRKECLHRFRVRWGRIRAWRSQRRCRRFIRGSTEWERNYSAVGFDGLTGRYVGSVPAGASSDGEFVGEVCHSEQFAYSYHLLIKPNYKLSSIFPLFNRAINQSTDWCWLFCPDNVIYSMAKGLYNDRVIEW
jgi:hypothetical protein